MFLKKYSHLITVFAMYLIASIALTYPLIFQMRSMVFGDFGDSRGSIWSIWAHINTASIENIRTLISAPFGSTNVNQLQPVYDALFFVPAHAIGEIAAYNLIVLLSFPLTAFATYFLLYYLLNNKVAAFIGGLIFGFCPGAVMQAVGGHLSFAFNMFIPLFLLALFYNREKRNWVSAFLVGLSYALLTLNSLYFGYFTIFIILFFLIFDFFVWRESLTRQWVLNYCCAAFSVVVLILPFQYNIIVSQLTASNSSLLKAGRVRDIGSLFAYSARPVEYLLPSIDHPVLGRFVSALSADLLHGSNYFEQTLYLGAVPLVLCVVGFFLWFRGRAAHDRHEYYLFFTLGALWMLLLSMPPSISCGSLQIPTVSHFMYKIAPMFRVYSRFGILVDLFVACAAAVVMSELSQRIRKMRYYTILLILFPLLVFEYMSIPPHLAGPIDPPPAVYQWLAKEPGDFIIAEYPMMNSDEASFYTYLFWQRIHKKRIVNGATPDNENAWNFYEKVRDLTDPETPRLLKSVGVKYIVVHEKMYEEGQIPEALRRYYPPQASKSTYNMNETYTDSILPAPVQKFGQDILFEL